MFDLGRDNKSIVACSNCFSDYGILKSAEKIGIEIGEVCPNCKLHNGRKLTYDHLIYLARVFFEWGSVFRCDYGAFFQIIFNEYQKTSINLNVNLKEDVKIFEEILKVGFFEYGPNAWMYGEIEPLKKLQKKNQRNAVIRKIIKQYPPSIINADEIFFRIRKDRNLTYDPAQFDSPPDDYLGKGRLDANKHPVLYISSDLELCIHEVRANAYDDIFVAKLQSQCQMKLLDLTNILVEKGATEYESLGLAVNMIFTAGEYAYEITRDISVAVKHAGYDGIMYPSYFSSIRDGVIPHLEKFNEHEHSNFSNNIAIFGRPIDEGKFVVKSINRLVITNIDYSYLFGPVL